MGERVHTAQAFLKGHGGHGGSDEHAFARDHVLAIGMGIDQMLLDQANALHGNARRHRVIQGRAKGFNVMGQSVHARGRRQGGRQASGQNRVENHRGREQFRVADHPFDVLFALGQHGFAAEFRTRASSGR
ncbi:hypothetical protein D3C71_1712390 [compost metagenome]